MKGKGPTIINYDSIANRPKQAVMVMQVISIWSHIDHLLAIMATNFLRADFEAVNDMLQALTSSDGRRAALKAVAQSSLTPDDFVLYEAVMKVIKPSRDRRNDYAHHVWGYVPGVDDVLLLINPKYLSEHHAKSEAASLKAKQRFDEMTGMNLVANARPQYPDIDLSKILVYREKDIQEDMDQAKLAHSLVFHLRFALSSHPAAADMRNTLCNRPQVQQALQTLPHENNP